MEPVIIVNFKAYREATARDAEALAKMIEKYCIVAVQNADIYRVSRIARKVYAQHIDPVGYGAFTGHDTAYCLKENGASGVIINHSEDQMPMDSIKKAVEIAREAGLETVVCIRTPELVKKVSNFKPDFIAYESPELIGSGISVTTRPDTIKKVIELAGGKTPVLCGAGITKADDVRKAIALGCSGIVVASGVVKASNPAAVISSFRQASGCVQ
ncbi:MAG: triosephosphate isomerase [Candidatus Aenigmarchaeota archaeon]|nr:triosephosphate isomerase [Candidatus Aenigmarchaeota archaeon]